MNAMKNTILSLMLIFVIIMPAYSNDVQEGKKLTFDRKKGNCLACHMIDDGELAGNSGPPLIAMKARFPDREVLFNQIWDPTKNNPNTFMPPFGKHGAISKDEINKIIEYLYTL
ncbi:MAG: sulfur oxidation c-type cytochrome SoxX [Pseudomonadota bacterium]|nr:sulfur oxidation c-type cytochrome SoxX [Pseudomonadota bacterium]|tara:strand:- start:441 stop:782 length:342 start_codon:yes stop_codon:yes gene_type:complete